MRAVIRTLVPCLAALAATGCLGGTHNPSYFPFYLPTGDIIRTHAKPPGTGYFRNFDPKACKVEVSPACVTSPTKSRQVFVATVFDSDGQPRRARRVEWILDGPGSIVEVDESGYFPGRGYKVDNRYAVSYTDYFEHCISRGNDDPRDDFTIRPGQTWCVVSCPVEGQTTVTAYAPGVFDWDQGRALATVTWSDSAFQFPPATTVRSGGETELTTTVAHPSDTAGRPVDYKVRYRIVGGTPASLVPRSGSTGTYAANAQEAEALADATGAAGVRVTQPTPQPGKTRVAVEVLKPDPNGIGRGTVVGRTETVVEWSSPQVTLDVKLPRAVPLDRETHVPIVLANAGSVDATAATVRAAMPEGAELVRADPPPTTRQPGLDLGARPCARRRAANCHNDPPPDPPRSGHAHRRRRDRRRLASRPDGHGDRRRGGAESDRRRRIRLARRHRDRPRPRRQHRRGPARPGDRLGHGWRGTPTRERDQPSRGAGWTGGSGAGNDRRRPIRHDQGGASRGPG